MIKNKKIVVGGILILILTLGCGCKGQYQEEFEEKTSTGNFADTMTGNEEIIVETRDELCSDNITRRYMDYYMVDGEDKKFMYTEVRNITVCEVVDIFKEYQGETDLEGKGPFTDEVQFLKDYYTIEYGLQHDFSYLDEKTKKLYLCHIGHTSKGFYFTYYDSVKDWFEVVEFKGFTHIERMDGTREFYLTNLSVDEQYIPNTIEEFESEKDDYIFICSYVMRENK